MYPSWAIADINAHLPSPHSLVTGVPYKYLHKTGATLKAKNGANESGRGSAIKVKVMAEAVYSHNCRQGRLWSAGGVDRRHHAAGLSRMSEPQLKEWREGARGWFWRVDSDRRQAKWHEG